MTVTTFRLPDLGEGLTESEIITWYVAEGDEVELNQVLAEVETAKAVVDLPSPYAGRIATLHAAEGEEVAVGAPLIDFELAAAPSEARPAAAPSEARPAAAPSEARPAAAPSEARPAGVPAAAAGAAPTPAASRPADAPAPAQNAPPRAAEAAGSGASAVAAASAGAPVPASPPPERHAVLVGYGPRADGGARPRRRARAFTTVPYRGHSGSEHRDATPKAMPPVRMLARHLGVDLTTVHGSGPGGLILRSDVELSAAAREPATVGGVADQTAPAEPPATAAAAPGPATAGSAANPAAPPEHTVARPPEPADRASTYVPVTGLRKRTAQAMTESAFTAPHAAVFSTIDVTESLALVRRAESRGHAPTFLALACRAVVLAARRTPAANARFAADQGHIELFGHLHLGIAVATDRGLVVATIPDADTMDAGTLAEEIATRAGRAREGTLTPAELTGSTLSVTNVGVFDVDGGVPILNPGQSVIVALGTVRTRPWEHEGRVALREVVTVTVSFDHRVLDGAEASAFLSEVTELLSDPAIALTR